MKSKRSSHAVAQAVLLCVPSLSLAGAAFSSGSATWSWDADTNSTLGGKTVFAITPPSSSALPTSPTYQLNRTGTSGTTTAVGKGSIGYIANATTASWTFSGGSGAAQSDPTNTFTGDTITKVQFGGLFDVTSPGLGPTSTGYFSLGVAGTAGIGGSTQIAFDMQWRLNGPSGALLRSAISDGTTFLGGGSGLTFSKTWTYSTAFTPNPVSASDNIWVGGSLTFIAENGGTPSDINPIAFEASAAPPTATFYGLPGNNSDWFEQVSWQVPENAAANIFAFTEPGALVPVIPNGIGQRARVINSNAPSAGEPRGISLTQPATIGALHIETNSQTTINNAGSTGNTLTMDVEAGAGNATMFVGAAAGDNDHGISASVVLADSLDVRVESTAPGSGLGGQFTFGAPITNVGGTPKDVNVRGTGAVNYNAANDYGGATNILEGGSLRANANGCLGTGSVNVTNGLLTINVSQPFQTTGVVNVGPGGQVKLGTIPVNDVTLNIADSAGYSGSSAVLAATSVNSPAGLVLLQPGAFVGHEDFSLAAADNPQSIGTTPLFVFAISNDFVDPSDPSIAIGDGTVSPWIGFGSDRFNRVYGSVGGPQVVQILGQGELFSGGSELTMNAALQGATEATANIRGNGVITLAAPTNDFLGQIAVKSGATLKVNGTIPTLLGLTVESGGLLGGSGSIGGNVTVLAGGAIDPGIGFFNNVTQTLHTNDISFAPTSLLDFEFGVDELGMVFNDQVDVAGTLVLDGELLINQLQGFDAQATYVLFTYDGALVDNGLSVSPLSQEIFGVPAASVASVVIIPNTSGPGGVVVLNVPEPALGLMLPSSLMLAARRRKCCARATSVS